VTLIIYNYPERPAPVALRPVDTNTGILKALRFPAPKKPEKLAGGEPLTWQQPARSKGERAQGNAASESPAFCRRTRPSATVSPELALAVVVALGRWGQTATETHRMYIQCAPTRN
jgi:hypothetical protein